MRLIQASTQELVGFADGEVPRYAILSHRWGEEEVTLQDMQVLKVARYASQASSRLASPLSSLSLQEMQAWSIIDSMQRLAQSSSGRSETFVNSSMWSLRFGNHVRIKRGFAKIEQACKAAIADDLQYVWVDTCCIDKSSSAELSEAINSMYKWYHGSAICYAYLADISGEDFAALRQGRPSKDSAELFTKFANSRWFSRGWTLQELVAPPRVRFYTGGWQRIGEKADLVSALADATGVDYNVLKGKTSAHDLTIATRMQWASNRETTRVEDQAYCLLGLFDVNMPLLYGEGEKAFLRLQEEIIKSSDDHSIFAWTMSSDEPQGLLASSPAAFVDCSNILRRSRANRKFPHSLTNVGLSIELRMRPSHIDTYEALLDCYDSRENSFISIYLYRLPVWDHFARIRRNGVSRRSVYESGEGEPWHSRDGYVGQRPMANVPHPCQHGFTLRKLPKKSSGWALEEVLDQESWHKDTGDIKLRSHDFPTYCQLHFSDGRQRNRFVIVLGINDDFHIVAELQSMRNVSMFSMVTPAQLPRLAKPSRKDRFLNSAMPRPRHGDVLQVFWTLGPSCYVCLKVSEDGLNTSLNRKLFVDIQIEEEKPVSSKILSCEIGKPVLSGDIENPYIKTYYSH